MRCSVARAPSHGVRRLFRVRINATRLPSACERTAPTTQRTPRPDAVASRRSESRQQSTGAMVSPDQHPALGGLVKSVLSGWLAGLAIPLIGCGSAPAQQSATTPLPVAPSHVPAPVDAESERLYNEAVRELASFRSFGIRIVDADSLGDAFLRSGTEITRGLTLARSVAVRFAAVAERRHPVWRLAAFEAQAEAYAILARAIEEAEITVKPFPSLPPPRGQQIEQQIEERMAIVRESRVAPIRCLAITRFRLVQREANLRIDGVEEKLAIADRAIAAFDATAVAECDESNRATGTL